MAAPHSQPNPSEPRPRPMQRSLSFGGVTRSSRRHERHRNVRGANKPYSVSSKRRHRVLNSSESSAENEPKEGFKSPLSIQDGDFEAFTASQSSSAEESTPGTQYSGSFTIVQVGQMLEDKLCFRDENETDGKNGPNFTSTEEPFTSNTSEEGKQETTSREECFKTQQGLFKGNDECNSEKKRQVQGGAIPKKLPLRSQNRNKQHSGQRFTPTQTVSPRMPSPSCNRHVLQSFQESCNAEFSGMDLAAFIPTENENDELSISSPSFEDMIYFYDQDIHPRQQNDDDIGEIKLRRQDTWLLPPETTTDDEFSLNYQQPVFNDPFKAVVLGHLPKEFLCVEENDDEASDVESESDEEMPDALKTSYDKSSFQNLLNRTTQFKCVMCDADLELLPDMMDRSLLDIEEYDFNNDASPGNGGPKEEKVCQAAISRSKGFGETDLYCPQCGCRRCGYYKDN